MFLNKFTMSFLVLLGFYLFLSNGGLLDLISIKKDIAIKKEQISNLEKEIKKHKIMIKQAKSKKFIERYARTKLGMVKKNEIIYEPK